MLHNALPKGHILRSSAYQYHIDQVLGSGGFGITYLATAAVRVGNVVINAQFAIKEHFLSSDCEREEGTSRVVYSNPARARVESSRKDFISEASRLSKIGLDHPNIVRVNEVFEANNTAYYVMEYLNGESLRSYVKRNGTLPEEEALEIMTPIIDAVRALHAARMTHLDIKPDNIMLASNPDGTIRPVLIDFGLAKHYDKDGRPTSTINTLGCSDGYAPIEQYVGITTFSPSADIYALGATLTFCLIGQDPRKASDLLNTPMADTLPAAISDEMRHRIAAMTSPDATTRTYGNTFGEEAPKHGAEAPTPPLDRNPTVPIGSQRTAQNVTQPANKPSGKTQNNGLHPVIITVFVLLFIVLCIKWLKGCADNPPKSAQVQTSEAVQEVLLEPTEKLIYYSPYLVYDYSIFNNSQAQSINAKLQDFNITAIIAYGKTYASVSEYEYKHNNARNEGAYAEIWIDLETDQVDLYVDRYLDNYLQKRCDDIINCAVQLVKRGNYAEAITETAELLYNLKDIPVE